MSVFNKCPACDCEMAQVGVGVGRYGCESCGFTETTVGRGTRIHREIEAGLPAPHTANHHFWHGYRNGTVRAAKDIEAWLRTAPDMTTSEGVSYALRFADAVARDEWRPPLGASGVPSPRDRLVNVPEICAWLRAQAADDRAEAAKHVGIARSWCIRSAVDKDTAAERIERGDWRATS